MFCSCCHKLLQWQSLQQLNASVHMTHIEIPLRGHRHPQLFASPELFQIREISLFDFTHGTPARWKRHAKDCVNTACAPQQVIAKASQSKLYPPEITPPESTCAIFQRSSLAKVATPAHMKLKAKSSANGHQTPDAKSVGLVLWSGIHHRFLPIILISFAYDAFSSSSPSCKPRHQSHPITRTS